MTDRRCRDCNRPEAETSGLDPAGFCHSQRDCGREQMRRRLANPDWRQEDAKTDKK